MCRLNTAYKFQVLIFANFVCEKFFVRMKTDMSKCTGECGECTGECGEHTGECGERTGECGK